MVINRGDIKRKRKDNDDSILLEDSPKRTKVHAQRKFAQGTIINNSPILTPIREFDKPEKSRPDVLPEPQELLPMKRPHTEDFLTFLCFRGTSMLPQSLNFFSNAPVTDSSSEQGDSPIIEPQKLPLPTSSMSIKPEPGKERPFIAFGVRKRADPVLISKQMDKKRRHALALQALRRKYQEQRMAKIRAVTISKLSEKVTSKSLVRTRSVTKNETSIKKNITQKTRVKVVSTKHMKMTTTRTSLKKRPVKTTQVQKKRMCLRSFRGRFIHQELQVKSRKKKPPIKRNFDKKPSEEKRTRNENKRNEDNKRTEEKRADENKRGEGNKGATDLRDGEESDESGKEVSSEFSSDNEEPLVRNFRKSTLRPTVKVPLPKVVKEPSFKKPVKETSSRHTRSNVPLRKSFTTTRSQVVKKQKTQITKQLQTPSKMSSVKMPNYPMLRRCTILQTKEINKKLRKAMAKKKRQSMIANQKKKTLIEKSSDKQKSKIVESRQSRMETRQTKMDVDVEKKEDKKVFKKDSDAIKKDLKKEVDTKSQTKVPTSSRKLSRDENNAKTNIEIEDKKQDKLKKIDDKLKSCDEKLAKPIKKENNFETVCKLEPELKENEELKAESKGKKDNLEKKSDQQEEKKKNITKLETETKSKKSDEVKKIVKDQTFKKQVKQERETKMNTRASAEEKTGKFAQKTEKAKTQNDDLKRTEKINKNPKEEKSSTEEAKVPQRPSRKTKEAAAIYMEILGHKLVNEGNIDEDNISIDSFPELPNVRKTEQRENELKAKAKTAKTKDKNLDNEKDILEKTEKKVPQKTEKTKESLKNKNIVELEKGTSTIVKDKSCNRPENIDNKTKIDVTENRKTKTQKDDETLILETDKKQKNKKADDEASNKILNEKLPSKSTARKTEKKTLTARNKELPLNSAILIETKKSRVDEDEKESCKSKERETKKPEPPPSNNTRIVSPSSDLSAEKLKMLNEKKAELGIKKEILSDSDDQADIKQKSVSHKRKKSLKIRPQPVSARSNSENSSSDSLEDGIKLPSKRSKDGTTVMCKIERFSDSDEEPLSKLTQISTKARSKEGKKGNYLKNTATEVRHEDKKEPSETQSSSTAVNKEVKLKSVKREFGQKNLKKKTEEAEPKPDNPHYSKPKRECTKRPSNYLTMFSSSDDDEKYFHGFVKSDNTKQVKQEKKLTSIIPSADLLCKDVDKRFGKGKVNMSTEQIEKWLKESALAGSSCIKKEEESLGEYEDKIPTETSLTTDIQSILNISSLKSCLLPEKEVSKSIVPTPKDNVNEERLKAPNPSLASDKNIKLFKTIERKTIFRKEKTEEKPNTKAFSPNNESSVYAFEAEKEEVISTPFRRPVRRPSSTTTSKSEEEFARNDETKASSKFRLPLAVKSDTLKNQNKEVSLTLSTDDSSGGSIAVQVNLESSETFTEGIDCSEEQNGSEQLFYIPLQPGKQSSSNVIQGVAVKLGTEGPNQRVVMKAKLVTQVPSSSQKLEEKPAVCSTPMFPPSAQKPKPDTKSFQRSRSSDDDFKYKVPSSPSASSSSSTKVYKRPTGKARQRPFEICTPAKVNDFPSNYDLPQVVQAPVFYPNDKEFQDPLEYIEKIRHKAERFGICRIVPPSTFKPECKVSDDMRFTAYNQYVHKMLHRWGPNFKELMAIKKYLQTQSISLTHPPWIGGIEIDLPRLYQTVQSLGGLKEVIEKKKWPKVSELMKIPKSAQDRVTKLDDIYCKYLLPYDTLSPAEREKLFDEVETEWAKRESRVLLQSQEKVENTESVSQSDFDSDDESGECIVKGRNMALNTFYRIARNTMSMWFKATEPSAQEVEQEFWKHVNTRQCHICVHSGSIDSGNWGYGFAVSKNSPFARHAWNLKVLTNNSGSILRSMGPVMGVTVPTLHVGMVFTGCCWYRDPHHLPWIEYLHTGGNKIWYGIPDSMSEIFHTTLLKLVPNYCHNKTLWLPSDTAMVPPNLLVENGVSLCRTVQEPGHYVVVFPKAFTSSICTGYVVSESVYFAPAHWLKTAQKVFEDMRNSCEPSMFSLDRLILSIAADNRSHVDVLKQIIPKVQELCLREQTGRKKLQVLGLNKFEKVEKPEAMGARRRRKVHSESGDYECEVCRTNLFVSWVVESQEDGIFCLEDAIENIEKQKAEAANCKLMYTYDDEELSNLVGKIENNITNKLQKKHGQKPNL